MTTISASKYHHPVFMELISVYEKHDVTLAEGSAIFAYALGYARGLQQVPIMDLATVQNIHLGWADGVSVEAADFIREEDKS